MVALEQELLGGCEGRMGPGGGFMPVAVEIKAHKRAAIVTEVHPIRVEHGDWEGCGGERTGDDRWRGQRMGTGREKGIGGVGAEGQGKEADGEAVEKRPDEREVWRKGRRMNMGSRQTSYCKHYPQQSLVGAQGFSTAMVSQPQRCV